MDPSSRVNVRVCAGGTLALRAQCDDVMVVAEIVVTTKRRLGGAYRQMCGWPLPLDSSSIVMVPEWREDLHGSVPRCRARSNPRPSVAETDGPAAGAGGLDVGMQHNKRVGVGRLRMFAGVVISRMVVPSGRRVVFWGHVPAGQQLRKDCQPRCVIRPSPWPAEPPMRLVCGKLGKRRRLSAATHSVLCMMTIVPPPDTGRSHADLSLSSRVKQSVG